MVNVNFVLSLKFKTFECLKSTQTTNVVYPKREPSPSSSTTSPSSSTSSSTGASSLVSVTTVCAEETGVDDKVDNISADNALLSILEIAFAKANALD